MGRWVWRSSSGRRRPARSPVSLEGYLAAIERDPVLIVPNRRTSTGSSATCCGAPARCSHGSIGTFDDLFRELALGAADARPVTSDAQRALVVRRALGRHAAERPRPLRALRRLRRRAARRARASSSPACSSRSSSTATSARLYAAYRGGARPARALGSRPAAPPRGRAAAVGARRLGRPTGLRLRLRGPDRRGVGAARGALGPRRGDRLAAVRAGPRRVRVAAADAGGSRARSPAGGSRSCRPRSAEYGHPALAHLERHLFADEPPRRPGARRRDPLLRGRRERAARSSSSPRRSASSRRAGTPLEEIALVVPSLERWRAPLETVLGTLGIPFAIEGRVRLGQTPFGQALLALLRFAWQQGGRRDLYAYLRSPFSGFARSNVDFLEGRLRGRGVATRERSRRRRSGCATGSRCRRSRRCAAQPGRSRPSARSRPRCCAARTASRRRRSASRAARPARLRRGRAAPRRARRLARARRRAVGRRGDGGARARGGAARRAPASGAASPCSTSPAPAPAASTPSSCSGSRRAACRAAATRRRSSTTTRAASSTGTRRARLTRPDRWRATATSSTRPARGRRGG